MSNSGVDDESTGATTIQQQENRHIESRAGRLGAVSGESQGSRDVEIATGEASSQRRNSNRFGNTQRGTTTGGIFRELIDDVDEQSAYHSSQLSYHSSQVSYHNSQLSYHNSQLERLSDRRRQLEDFYRELQAQAEEGNDVESEDDEELEEDE